MNQDKRLYFPAASRNIDPILNVLKNHVPQSGAALEIASGSGEHICAFARRFPNLTWHPSDIEADHIDSINAHRLAHGLENILPACHLDVLQQGWDIPAMDFIFNANMIHISPKSCTNALIDGVANILKSKGIFFIYGPFFRESYVTAPSNISFDESLRQRNPEWGIRQLEDVIAISKQNSLPLVDVVEMPSNNLSVIFQKRD